jgi:hypothetical protein
MDGEKLILLMHGTMCWSNLRIENENELNRKIREK